MSVAFVKQVRKEAILDEVKRMLLASELPFPMKTVKVAVVAIDRHGNALVPCFTVTCMDREYAAGGHYEMAREKSRSIGLEPQACFDENDPSWVELSAIAFDAMDSDSNFSGATTQHEWQVLI